MPTQGLDHDPAPAQDLGTESGNPTRPPPPASTTEGTPEPVSVPVCVPVPNLEGEPLEFADDQFAAIMSGGVLTTGHAPPSCLDELIRAARPGGHLIFTLSTPVYEEGGFRPKLEELCAQGRWRALETTPTWCALPCAPSHASVMARAYVFEVL
jgi:SAM-dependent methyltransferase